HRRYKYRHYPAIKIARLATHDDYRHRGIGENMLIEVFTIVGGISEQIGCRIVTVDSKPSAVGFYEQYDFHRAIGDPKNHPKDTVPLYFDIAPLLDELSQ